MSLDEFLRTVESRNSVAAPSASTSAASVFPASETSAPVQRPEIMERELEPEPVSEPEPAADLEPEIIPEPVAISEPESIPEPVAISEPESVPEPEVVPEPEIALEPERVTEPVIAAEPEPAAMQEPEEAVEVETAAVAAPSVAPSSAEISSAISSSQIATDTVASVPPLSTSLVDRIVAVMAAPAAAVDPDAPLDLHTAVNSALATHPSVVESVGNFYSSLEQIDVARAGYFPRVSAGIGNGYRRETSDRWDNFNVSASQTLYDFGRTSSSVDAASFGAERSRADILLTMDNLALDTAEAFIEVQRFQALLEVAREQVLAIAEIEELAETRSRMGASTQSDVLQARSRYEAALAMQAQLQAQLDMWKRSLQTYTGMAVLNSVDDAFPGGLNQSCSAFPEDFNSVPRMIAANAALEEAQARARQARADMFPTISLNANYGNVNNPSDIAFNEQLSDRDFTVSVSLDSALFQGGAAQSRRQAAQYSLQAAKAGKERALLEVSRSFREAHDQTQSFTDRLQYLDSRYDNIVSTQELYREQYLSLGTRTLLDLLNTEQEIYQSRFEREHTIHDLRQLQMVCLHSLGQLRNVFDIDTQIAEGTGR